MTGTVKNKSKLMLCAVLLTALLASAALAMDRAEFGKVLHLIPPNGPFWKYGNVVMQTKTREAGMAPVTFAHWSHRSRYTCRICHEQLGFSMRRGDSGITRKENLSGKFCGACHNGTIAFTVSDGDKRNCKKCHMQSSEELENSFADFARYLPMAPFGNGIDWSAALQNGDVTPVNSAKEKALQFPEKLKKPLKLGTPANRSDVKFSHEDHFAELDCSSCHPDIFNIKTKSTQSFTMEANIYGDFCGACHMLVAFPMNDCNRCHKSMGNSRY